MFFQFSICLCNKVEFTKMTDNVLKISMENSKKTKTVEERGKPAEKGQINTISYLHFP